MRKLFIVLIIFVLFVLGAFVVFNAATIETLQISAPTAPAFSPDKPTLQARAQRFIAFSTTDTAGFAAVGRWLPEAFPSLHRHPKFDKTVVNEWNIVLKWQGSNPNLKPAFFVASYGLSEPALHSIVQWRFNPFVGKVENDTLFGAGTQRSKLALLATLEALEMLAASGFEPEQTLYVVATADDFQPEALGARSVAAAFQYAGVQADWVLSPEGRVAQGISGLSPKPLALAANAEARGWSVRWTASGADAEKRLLETIELQRLTWEQMPIGAKPQAATFEYLAPEIEFLNRCVFANTWIFGAWRERIARQDPAFGFLRPRLVADAFPIREGDSVSMRGTFYAPYLADEPLAADLLAETAKSAAAGVATRLTPAPIEVLSQAAPLESVPFRLLQSTIKTYYPEALVIPAATETATGARYFRVLTDKVYYFAPLVQNPALYQAQQTYVNERIALADYYQMIAFYRGFWSDALK